MKIKIEKEDIINGNIELSRTLVSEALIYSQEEIKAKKLYLAYKNIEQTLKLLGINPQDDK
ncbi:MAG: hypothetical protein ABH864_03875 [archaeon]